MSASAGWEFSLLLDRSGHVFSTGHNRYGQLGHSDVVEENVSEYAIVILQAFKGNREAV